MEPSWTDIINVIGLLLIVVGVVNIAWGLSQKKRKDQ